MPELNLTPSMRRLKNKKRVSLHLYRKIIVNHGQGKTFCQMGWR